MLIVQQVCPVHNDAGLAVRWESVAVYARMGGGGQFGLDFLVGQRHGIISCFRVLVLMREGGSTIQRVGLEVYLLGGGAEQQVAQVDATSSAQVGV